MNKGEQLMKLNKKANSLEDELTIQNAMIKGPIISGAFEVTLGTNKSLIHRFLRFITGKK